MLMMKAIIWTKYGLPDGLELQQIEKPTPRDHEVLVQIHATSVTAGDCEMRRLQLPLMLSFPMRLYAGALKPKRIRILGQEFAGQVVEAGKDVKSFKPGDAVFGTTGFGFGAYTQYICLPGEPAEMAGTLALKPANLGYPEAAVVPTAGFEALHFMRRANVGPGKQVLIVGAGGSIGTFSTQLARHYGAEVTGVDGPGKQELMRAAGANHVIDFTRQDYTQGGETYDLIIDVVGRQGVGKRLKRLKPDGLYFLAFAGPGNLLRSLWGSITGGKALKIESAQQTREELNAIRDLIEAGAIKPFIDRTFPLEEVREAHRYAESGRKLGNLAITVEHGEEQAA